MSRHIELDNFTLIEQILSEDIIPECYPGLPGDADPKISRIVPKDDISYDVHWRSGRSGEIEVTNIEVLDIMSHLAHKLGVIS